MLSDASSYSLYSRKDPRNKIEYFHLKLTESALKEIQSAIRSKQKIVFNETAGHFNIGNSRYEFLVAEPMNKKDNRILDVVRYQSKSNQSHSVCVLGSLSKRLTVLAKDDVFEATRIKAAQVETAVKSVCTKELEPVARSSALRKVMPPPGQLPPHKRRLKSKCGALAAPLTVISNIGAAPLKFSKFAQFGLRSRVIHLLAAHHYNKAELILRLTRDAGILGDGEKRELNCVLTEVAKIERNGAYSLRPTFLNEVMLDSWPGFNDNDRQIVARLLKKASQTQSGEPGVGKKRSAQVAFNKCAAHTTIKRLSKTGNASVAQKIGRFAQECSAMSKDQAASMFDETSPLSELSACSPLSETEVDRVRYSSPLVDSESKVTLDSRYPPLESLAQRSRYKLDFSNAYPLYKELWHRVQHHAKQIEKWDRQLCRERPGSDQHHKLQLQVFEFYVKLRNDGQVLQDLKSANDLHCKLRFIKERLRAFRNLSNMESSGGLSTRGAKSCEMAVAAW